MQEVVLVKLHKDDAPFNFVLLDCHAMSPHEDSKCEISSMR